ncbi:hypothetical protein X747_03480 [Mesorhizobium sp. LNJC384A00]|nr:hypothetical protein X771_17115 [Mesorhizobium sp. LSJC277A00]ESW93791.1 hypothetical protein X770_00105 [Mesorhizobium sp. LSJC269B00]ESX16681.1 hypothetical protein X766_21070 [Mesorhizobium sp. LSJC255A00]ESX44914.1 hypothetical protein X764_02150 [Mesorhizobium sp. LSHC440A00]ESX79959.1 hypothetical protein X757_02150 [Mesorhizobium sp. LSHC414A00]ESY44693.1 hypothetical protein X747_03480 [Mesorhizobium sp. LNJC384A00]ESZ66623.1 hypothetical protein X728_03355 [Mesorhizobium sp. L103C
MDGFVVRAGVFVKAKFGRVIATVLPRRLCIGQKQACDHKRHGETACNDL